MLALAEVGAAEASKEVVPDEGMGLDEGAGAGVGVGIGVGISVSGTVLDTGSALRATISIASRSCWLVCWMTGGAGPAAVPTLCWITVRI